MTELVLRALFGGIAVACLAAPLGCLIMWRRMAYLGDTLAHSALLGFLLSSVLGIEPFIGIFLLSWLVGMVILYLRRVTHLTSDGILGLIAHTNLALGLVLLSLLGAYRFDLSSILFGDLLALRDRDLWLIAGVLSVVLLVLGRYWRLFVALTVSSEIAVSEDRQALRYDFLLIGLLSGTVVLAMKIVGILLVTALLILPAAAARPFARSPEIMALGAMGVGSLSVGLGLGGSFVLDIPAGPAIVVGGFLFFLVSLAVSGLRTWRGRTTDGGPDEPGEKL